MSIKSLFCLSIIATTLSACASSEPPSTSSPAMVTTLHSSSTKILKQYLGCLESQLKRSYPTASFTPITSNLYTGKVPGTELDEPRATFEIEAALDKIRTSVILQQQTPVDDALTTLFKDCL
ncbi:hypothetical protein [Pelistega europaea]|uniref:Lipoprotein n=1 Tax=Pelistega europaea TaxID=106147 RepID=A0A7Y4L8T6_9BURK|nr:hypothetical protein [Pelistega europaea]NOL49099.1 hypothetical protein [Pelistega europaea]